MSEFGDMLILFRFTEFYLTHDYSTVVLGGPRWELGHLRKQSLVMLSLPLIYYIPQHLETIATTHI